MSGPLLFRAGARYEFWQPAGTIHVPGKGDFPEQFAPGAFASQVGKVVPLKIGDRAIGHARVIRAVVADDGSGVTLTYEITDLTP